MARQQWSRETEYVLACVGNAVGLGNLWRFPYLCYSSGGGAFLIPYFVMLFICGIPLLYMELAVGQLTKRGPVGAMMSLCPLFQGVGLSTVFLSFFLATYYNVILSWALYFLFSSFESPLSWSSCNNSWNKVETCWSNENISEKTNKSESSVVQFFRFNVLHQSSGIEDPVNIQWELALLLLVTWIIVYFCIFKGIKWTGKIVYVTATFPYFIIIFMLIYGINLPGSFGGIKYFLKPEWELLKSPKVWVYAAAQNFNSIGIAFGSMITFASYSDRKNNVFRDSLFVCILNSSTSILAGFAVFSILGFAAYNLQVDVKDVIEQGPGLVFQVYPEAFSSMIHPWGNILAFFFFLNILCLGIDSQFASVEVVVTTVDDHLNNFLNKFFHKKEFITLVVCVVAFVFGLPNVTFGGIYFFKLIDYYSSGISLMLIAFFEVIAITWFYGAGKLSKDIAVMNGKEPFLYFKMCWYVFAPLLILTIMIFNWIEYSPLYYGAYAFPKWADAIGWLIASTSLACIPVGMIKSIYEAKGNTFLEKFKNSMVQESVSDHDTKEINSGEKPFPHGLLLMDSTQSTQL